MATKTPLTRQEQICLHIASAISERAVDNRETAIQNLSEAYQLAQDLEVKEALNDATHDVMDRESCIAHCERARAALDVDPEAAAERVGWPA